jgi:hypothetical protein
LLLIRVYSPENRFLGLAHGADGQLLARRLMATQQT